MFILKCCSTVSAAAFALRRWRPDVRGFIKPMLYGFYLLPWYFRNLTDDIVGSLVDEYQNDIPYPDDLPQEVLIEEKRSFSSTHNCLGLWSAI
jgi:hypothetical protein